MTDQPVRIDQIDQKILNILSHDARIPMAELARKVGLSKTPVAARVRRLEQAGVITGYRAVISPIRLGRSYVVWVEIRVTDTREPALRKFNDAVRLIPEVEECHMIAGGFDYLLKLRTRDIDDYRRLMGDRISALPYVNATSTYVSMEAVID
ncbi:Lrp/AsnC family transcriptional regulator [Paracoccus jiaweipingae]|uniref:Lrp/AsnC family transcriptional regulator n=1 Tax=unclassified Paracoccus (in: a-proteobacteria) TaxID=2688777 RepID=UPI0037AD1880